jgi:hypothetical protein
MMKYFTCIIVGLILIACGSSGLKEQDLAIVKDSISKDPETVNSEEMIESHEPWEIKEDLFAKRKIEIKKPFDPILLMHKIYQGETTKDEWEDKYPVVEFWKCTKCQQRKFETFILGDTILFPSAQGNDTRVLKVLDFVDEEKNIFKILATTSSEFSSMHDRTGRFSCGILGLSFFKKENDLWKMQSFHPALGCYGMFQKVNIPEILSERNNFLIWLNNNSGCPGGPYYGNTAIFGLYKNEFKVLLNESFTSRQGTFENNGIWNTKIKIVETDKYYIPKKIQLVISGDFNYQRFIENDTISNLPDLIRKNVKPDDNYLFEIKKNYLFKDGNYILENEAISKKPGLL